MDLNPAQKQAVATLRGPLLVLAGAGTGKTRVVTCRIAALIRHGVAPDRILAVTFTNKAAREMQERVAAILGRRPPSRPEISTFHSLCVRILRRRIGHLGYPPQFAIYDRGDQEALARSALREIKIDTATLRPGDLLHLIGRWKNASLDPRRAGAAAQTDKEHLAAAAYRRYQQGLKAVGAVDFDDLLLLTEELFRRFPDVRRQEAERFDHLLVDEYQDTNGSQYRIVKALAAGHRNLCVVGDDDQSIYGWRGAEVTHILRFQRDWSEARVVRLEENYRSTEQIVAWANRLIAFNRHRHGKVLRARIGGEPPRIRQYADETAEAKGIVEEIAARIRGGGARPGEIAVLFRTNEQPRAFETEFRRADLPYVLLGSTSFFDRKEVRDVLAYLKLAARPRDDVALLRVINTPPRGIGPSTVARLVEEALARSRPLWEVLAGPSLRGLTPAASQAVAAFRETMAAFQHRADGPRLVELARSLIAEVRYEEEIRRQYSDENERQGRWAAVEEVVNALAAYTERSARPRLAEFLQEVTLGDRDDDRDKEKQLRRDAVALLTLHSAKGLEFPEVYLVGMEEGILPHKRSIGEVGEDVDEERRLCYVGVTRAQRRLTLSMAMGRHKWGKLRETIPSRFLYELTGQAENPNYRRIVAGQRPRKSAAGARKAPR